MCIAIVKPAGKWVSREQLQNSFTANPAGAGYAFIHDGKVVVKKGYFTFDEFYTAYSADVKADTPALAHFRIVTRGGKNAENCHPFLIDHGAVMHNGPCLNFKWCNGDKERSDSRQFAEDYVKTLPYETVKLILPIISGFAGTEKVAFLFDNGEHLIANEKEGVWSEGCWFSNNSFRGYAGRGQSNFQDFNDYGDFYGGGYHRGSSRTTRGTQTGAPPRSEAYKNNLIKRTFGNAPQLFDCRWSEKLRVFVPIKIVVNKIEMRWDESLNAFVPTAAKNALCTDKRYVYEATDTAQARDGGPNFRIDTDWVIVGDVLMNDHDLRIFLIGATNVPLPPAPATDAAPPAADTTSTAADASAAPASATVH